MICSDGHYQRPLGLLREESIVTGQGDRLGGDFPWVYPEAQPESSNLGRAVYLGGVPERPGQMQGSGTGKGKESGKDALIELPLWKTRM